MNQCMPTQLDIIFKQKSISKNMVEVENKQTNNYKAKVRAASAPEIYFAKHQKLICRVVY